MSPVGLRELLQHLPKKQDPNLLVGFDTHDDAAIYRLNEETALVLTADVITPPVDDPRLFGEIAAANALSDVYAMGGRPTACLNLVGFPADRLEPGVLHEIILGALAKITEADAVLAGGHTTADEEPKFGLSVIGVVHPDRFWTNAGARAGDVLILTKPIGSGVLFNANRKGWVSQAAMDHCLKTLTTLNRKACEVLQRFEVHAVTDITGFGLAGHGLEMAEASAVTLRIDLDSVPLLPEAIEMYERGMSTGVNAANRRLVEGRALVGNSRPARHTEIWFDPQTSGGLMAAVAAQDAEAALAALRQEGVPAAQRIGFVEPFDGHHSLILS